MGIARRRAQLGVTEQNLDHADVRTSLQQMRGKAVPQGMQRGWLSFVDSLAIKTEPKRWKSF